MFLLVPGLVPLQGLSALDQRLRTAKTPITQVIDFFFFDFIWKKPTEILLINLGLHLIPSRLGGSGIRGIGGNLRSGSTPRFGGAK